MKDVKIKAKNLWFWALVGDAYRLNSSFSLKSHLAGLNEQARPSSYVRGSNIPQTALVATLDTYDFCTCLGLVLLSIEVFLLCGSMAMLPGYAVCIDSQIESNFFHATMHCLVKKTENR
jgi:hypothetical protein